MADNNKTPNSAPFNLSTPRAGIRETAKWVVAASAGLATLAIGGSSFSSLGSINSGMAPRARLHLRTHRCGPLLEAVFGRGRRANDSHATPRRYPLRPGVVGGHTKSEQDPGSTGNCSSLSTPYTMATMWRRSASTKSNPMSLPPMCTPTPNTPVAAGGHGIQAPPDGCTASLLNHSSGFIWRDRSCFAPCLPVDWKTFKIHYRYRQTLYHITYHNGGGGNRQSPYRGRSGKTDRVLQMNDDHQEHGVEVEIE